MKLMKSQRPEEMEDAGQGEVFEGYGVVGEIREAAASRRAPTRLRHKTISVIYLPLPFSLSSSFFLALGRLVYFSVCVFFCMFVCLCSYFLPFHTLLPVCVLPPLWLAGCRSVSSFILYFHLPFTPLFHPHSLLFCCVYPSHSLSSASVSSSPSCCLPIQMRRCSTDIMSIFFSDSSVS